MSSFYHSLGPAGDSVQHSGISDDQSAGDPYGAYASTTQIPYEVMSFLIKNHQTMLTQNNKSSDQIVRGSWTQQEDEQLEAAVRQLGTQKWSDIARFVPTRTSKQCRERWFHRLSPEIRRDPFELWEDKIIVDTQREIGNRWSVIAKKLPGRSSSAVKNRWYSGLRIQHAMNASLDMNNSQGGTSVHTEADDKFMA